ncbi:MAG: hypothetical protein R3F11_14315 [Verrucomicrobiales bacterium]
MRNQVALSRPPYRRAQVSGGHSPARFFSISLNPWATTLEDEGFREALFWMAGYPNG